MGDPPREEQRAVVVARSVGLVGGAEVIANVVERHEDHDETAQRIDRLDTSRRRRRGVVHAAS